ncbi:nucleotidyltransferase family protein [Micromonospora sp. C28ISP2-4]|uniref:nucleotidyltransferase family protein n=1 Tax=Micromonospora sp. C28ISP2-4 TaxID=3059523 RepID=UPI002674ABBE|nr:nucleotidyltransferase family protein [Micromonospora sp. C28ISP2-4]MDO3686492.1 nucleotidyltransferase family protein [Micromonospora sp. C28ISP2-4]
MGSHLAPTVTTYPRRPDAGNEEHPSDNTADALIDLIRSSTWLVRVLETVRDESLADAWVGAGVLRDLVWGERYGSGFSPARVRDVDVAFFDPHDLSRSNDDRVTEQLRTRLPGVPWEAKNQAAVHIWYPGKFGGGAVEPLKSIQDAVNTWPETATAVAVRLDADDAVEICAPLGVGDLLNGVWRRNPRRVTIAQSLTRLERHQPRTRWPGVTVIPPA